MTRQEFLDNVTEIYELVDFCEENGLDTTENIVDADYRDEYINDNLVGWARDDGWRDLLSRLNQFDEDSGYDYYEYDEYYGEFRPVDSYDLQQRVLDDADHEDIWDAEEEEDEDDEVESGQEDEMEIIECECEVEDMLAESRNVLREYTERELDILGEGLRSVSQLMS